MAGSQLSIQTNKSLQEGQLNMELTKQQVDEIKAEIKAQLDAQAESIMPQGISSNDLCQNKDVIIGLLNAITALIPGSIGKLVS